MNVATQSALVESGRRDDASELQVSAQHEVAARAEMEGAILVAHRFPRDEHRAMERMRETCDILAFAETAVYAFPRGGAMVTGPSVNMAREFARAWGNMRYGAEIVHDDDERRVVRCYAIDLQSNTRNSEDVSFRKLIQRKQKDGKTQWVRPDERDLRELTNRLSAIGTRNCILHLMPRHVGDALVSICDRRIRKGIDEDPVVHKDRLLTAFSRIGVSQPDIERYLSRPLDEATSDDVAELRKIYSSIADGNARRDEFFKPEPKKTAKEKKPRAGKKAPRAEEADEMADMVPQATDMDKWQARVKTSLTRATTADEVLAAVQNAEQSCPVELEIARDWLVGASHERLDALGASRKEGLFE